MVSLCEPDGKRRGFRYCHCSVCVCFTCVAVAGAQRQEAQVRAGGLIRRPRHHEVNDTFGFPDGGDCFGM